MIDELSKPAAQLEQAMFEMRRVVVGQDRVLERLMVALLAGGHCLLEGVPGLGKTLTLSTMARVLGGEFSRIQFTPDLLPSDITGTRIYLASQERFDVEPGPVLANFVLADEINRAPAKVQAAMLEVMAEKQVTIGDRTFAAPSPFLVMATQNPIESEGVYPLPEAQRDRFMMRVPVGYPSIDEEREIVRRMDVLSSTADPILDPSDVIAMQRAASSIFVDQKVVDYALRIVTATRRPTDVGMGQLDGLLEYGASPRASIALIRGASAMALLRGRSYALPQDVYEIAYDVLNHRVVLSYEALADGVTVDDVLVELLSKLPAPRITVAEAHEATQWAAPVPTRRPAETPPTTQQAPGAATSSLPTSPPVGDVPSPGGFDVPSAAAPIPAAPEAVEVTSEIAAGEVAAPDGVVNEDVAYGEARWAVEAAAPEEPTPPIDESPWMAESPSSDVAEPSADVVIDAEIAYGEEGNSTP